MSFDKLEENEKISFGIKGVDAGQKKHKCNIYSRCPALSLAFQIQ